MRNAFQKIEVYKKLERWGEWVINNRGGYFPRQKSFLAKAMDGLPTTKCIRCGGVGKVKSVNYEKNKQIVNCKYCFGKGKIMAKSSPNKINPAFIRSTNPGVPISDEVMKIQRMINALTKLQQLVIHVEFSWPVSGTYKEKARQVYVKQEKYMQDSDKRMTEKAYKGLLKRALIQLERRMMNRGMIRKPYFHKGD